MSPRTFYQKGPHTFHEKAHRRANQKGPEAQQGMEGKWKKGEREGLEQKKNDGLDSKEKVKKRNLILLLIELEVKTVHNLSKLLLVDDPILRFKKEKNEEKRGTGILFTQRSF